MSQPESVIAESINLAERIRKEFGFEVSVIGGRGSRTDPWYIIEPDCERAALHTMQLLTAFSSLQNALWRVDRVQPVDDAAELLRVVVERIRFQDGQAIAERIPYFLQFDAPVAQVNPLTVLGCVQPHVGLALPYQLGWLHYQGANESMPPDVSGGGFAAPYGAPGIEATVFLYKGGSSVRLNVDDIANEFAEADRVLQIHSGNIPIGDEDTVHPELARLPWKIRTYSTAEGGMAFLMLTAAGDHFIKVRLAARPDAKVVECARATCEELLHIADVVAR
ncbi:MAG: hypothetical protein ABI616_05090 [Pseudomonadota bacterium]